MVEPWYCWVCAEPLGDEPRAEIVTKDDMLAADNGWLGEEADISHIIHQSCFDTNKHVIA